MSEAKTTCADGSSAECAAAWDVVEEISAANSHAKAKAKARGPEPPAPFRARVAVGPVGATLRAAPARARDAASPRAHRQLAALLLCCAAHCSRDVR